ncbi:MAG: DNA-binding protein [Desulfobacterales bacterium]|nr:DNA-binding protein [Desulfobacterales bacterium]
MKKMYCSEYKLGRRLLGCLPHGKDLIQSIEDFCREASIQMATFSMIGAVSSFTLGAYDQQQQVYVTFSRKTPAEIITCTGNISIKDKKTFVHAHIVLGDEQGETIGGHLFSESIIFAGEIELQELIGKPMERSYDQTTGLWLWRSS